MIRFALWILGGLLLAGTASAQPGQVQAVRSSGADNLSRHLSRLASNPRDVDALIGAGEAAVELGDTGAAAGFFSRADSLQPNNGRVKAGLGRLMLKTQNPAEALRLFDQATRLGFGEATLLGDRGLARDMTGDQAGAQRDYQAAIKRAPNDDELVYRYAASLGISGQVDEAEKALQPLLYKGDRAAWRYRAFILAMNNRQADAKKIASQTMPARLAEAIIPYMQKMPYLTAAQKAAAVHFGHFPANVGTGMAAVTPTPPPASSVGVPAGTGSSPRRTAAPPRQQDSISHRSQGALAQASVPQPPMSQASARPRQPQVPAPSIERPVAQPAVQGPPAPAPDAGASARPQMPAAPSTPASQLNAITLAQASAPASQPVSSAQAAPPPATAPRPQPNADATRTLAEIIRAIDVPDAERQSTVAAVDLAEIAAMQAQRRAAAEKAKKAAEAKAKAKAEAEAKARKAAEEKARLAANPSRNWVQIGTGSDRGALAFTLKGLRRKYDDIAPQDAWVAGWGRTNRLLIGPFASFTRARTVESKLKSAGADAFAWQSDAGEVVERLGGK